MMLSVTTKTGDKGQSGLANGERADKDSLIFEVLGTLDELNSWLGLCITQLTAIFKDEKNFLLQTQDTLFHLGAELARSPKTKLPDEVLELLEKRSENLQSQMVGNWTTKFIYPGGTTMAAQLDVTRTVCRRLERVMVKLSKEQKLRPLTLKYINRLSDYLFVLRCFVNQSSKVKEKKFEYAQKLVENFS